MTKAFAQDSSARVLINSMRCEIDVIKTGYIKECKLH
jgi:hypothetical protein